MSYTPTSWTTGDTITASALNKIEQGIANAGGGKYDAYDFVISQVDSGTPVLEKGIWQDVYDALQNMDHVVGLYLYNSTPGQWHDTISLFVPLTFVDYYSSADSIMAMGLYFDSSGRMRASIQWEPNGTITVTKIAS